VAYRHPAAYKTLFGAFMIMSGVVYVALQVWDFGAMVMYHTMHPYIDREKLDVAEKAADAFYILNGKSLVVWLCLTVYLTFLGVLPSFGVVAPDAKKDLA